MELSGCFSCTFWLFYKKVLAKKKGKGNCFCCRVEAVLDKLEVSDQANDKQEAIWSLWAPHRHSVVYTDVRDANVLWHSERVMSIDFEQVVLVGTAAGARPCCT